RGPPRLERRGAVRLNAHALADALARVLVDQDGPADHLGMLLEMRGEVHALTHTGVGDALLGAGEASDERTRGDADADADLHAAPPRLLLVEPIHQREH